MVLALMVVVVAPSVTGAMAMQGQSDWDPNMGSGRGSYIGGGYVRDDAGCWHVADPRQVWGTSSRDDKKLKLTPRRKEGEAQVSEKKITLTSPIDAMDKDLDNAAAVPGAAAGAVVGMGNAVLLRQRAGKPLPRPPSSPHPHAASQRNRGS